MQHFGISWPKATHTQTHTPLVCIWITSEDIFKTEESKPLAEQFHISHICLHDCETTAFFIFRTFDVEIALARSALHFAGPTPPRSSPGSLIWHSLALTTISVRAHGLLPLVRGYPKHARCLWPRVRLPNTTDYSCLISVSLLNLLITFSRCHLIELSPLLYSDHDNKIKLFSASYFCSHLGTKHPKTLGFLICLLMTASGLLGCRWWHHGRLAAEDSITAVRLQTLGIMTVSKHSPLICGASSGQADHVLRSEEQAESTRMKLRLHLSLLFSVSCTSTCTHTESVVSAQKPHNNIKNWASCRRRKSLLPLVLRQWHQFFFSFFEGEGVRSPRGKTPSWWRSAALSAGSELRSGGGRSFWMQLKHSLNSDSAANVKWALKAR